MPQVSSIRVIDSSPTGQKDDILSQPIRVIDKSIPNSLDPSSALSDDSIRTLESVDPLTNFANAFQKELISGTQADFSELLSGAGGFEGHEKAMEVRQSAEERLPTRGGASEFLGRSIAGVAPFLPALVAPVLSIPILGLYGLRAMGQGRGAVRAHEEITGEDISGTTEAAVAAGYGLAVYVTERIGLRNFRGLIDKLAPAALRRIAKVYSTGSAKGTAKTMLGEIAKVPAAGAYREAKQEGLEQSLTNVIDMTYGAKNMGDLFQGVPEAAAAGAIGGGLIGGLGIGIQAKNIKKELERTGANRQIADDFPNLDFDQVNEVSSLVSSIASTRGVNPKSVYDEFEGKISVFESVSVMTDEQFHVALKKDGSLKAMTEDTQLILPVKFLRDLKRLSLKRSGVQKRIRGFVPKESQVGRIGPPAKAKNIDKLKQDIKEKGLENAISINIDNDGRINIFDGTHRLLALDELGIENVKIEIVPVVMTNPSKRAALHNIIKEADKLASSAGNKSEIVDQTRNFKHVVRKGSVGSFIRDTLPLFKRSVNQDVFQSIEASLKIKEPGKWTTKESRKFHKAIRKYIDDNVVEEDFSEDALISYRDWLAITVAHAEETTLLEDTKPTIAVFLDDVFTNSMIESQEAINPDRIKARKSMREKWDEFINILDVDNRFKDAPRLGIAVKSQFSVQDTIEGKTEHRVARVSRSLIKAGYTRQEIESLMQTLPLITEDATVFDKMPKDQKVRLQPTIDIIQEFFDDSLQLLKNEGALEQGFFEEMRTRIESERIKAKKTGDADKYRKLEKKLTEIKEASFVPIPFRIWFEKMAVNNPRKATRIMSELTTKERKTLFIGDLLRKKVIKKEDINMSQIMGYYGRRLGKDIAYLRIKNAGIESGFIKPLEKGQRPDRFNGFVRRPSSTPILKGFQIKNVLADYLNEASKYHDHMKLFDRGLSITKMGQFINPLFLPTYDLWQAAVAGSISPLRPIRTFKTIARAAVDFRDHNEYWMAAGIHNARSTPYVNPLEMYESYIQQISKHPNPVIRALHGIFSQDVLRQVYNASWKTAWALDGFVRQITYRHLTDNLGFSPGDSGRLTALFHADYAGIPAATRKKLNRIFFTPSFKVAMGKLYLKMMKDSINVSIKAGENIIKGRKIGENITQEEKLMMLSLGRTVGIIMTMDILMTTFLGFDRDEWGRRYTKEVETVEGVKDLVLTYGTPFNMMLKYYFRFTESFYDPSITNHLQTFFQKNSWELHPVWRMINGFMRNRRPDGRQIYEKFTGEGNTQIAAYFLSQSAALVDEVLTSISSEPEKVEMEKLLTEELGKAGSFFAHWFAFAYFRNVSDVVAASKSQRLSNELVNEIKFIIESRGKVSEEYIERATKNVVGRIKELHEGKN